MERKPSVCIWALEIAEAITRVWGILSMIVMWGVGVDMTVHKHGLGAYLLFIAVILTLLETSFAVNIFLDYLIKDEKNMCFVCWQKLQLLDRWKKTLTYFFLSIFCFLKPYKLWLGTVGGSMMVVLAFLYLLLTYKMHLVDQELDFDKETSYDRFADLQDDIDDSLPELTHGNITDQDSILQV